MIDVINWKWTIYKDEMVCRNLENNVTVKIEKDCENIRGILQDMPMELFDKIANIENGEKIIMQIVKSAEFHYVATEKISKAEAMRVP